MSGRNASHSSGFDHSLYQKGHDDNQLCYQILELDPAIRVAAILEGTEVSGFASTPVTDNPLNQAGGLKDKMGFWSSMLSEISRQAEPYFGNLHHVSFSLGKQNLIITPVSGMRSLALSVEKHTNSENLIRAVTARIDLRSPRTH